MSQNILDVSKWKDEYPFLKHVSEVFDKYNSNQYDGGNTHSYEGLCNSIINNVVYGDVRKHKDICMKLMRNLKYFSSNSKDYELSSDHCNILFHWLYGFLKDDKITYDLIDKCFENYDHISSVKKNFKKKCLYFKDDKFIEPTKITLLDIFNDNIPIIKTTLTNPNFSSIDRGRKYVCECVKIYKNMNESYCHNGVGKENGYNSTCLKLKNFKESYEFFYNFQGGSNFNIPSLDDKEFSEKCPTDEQDISLRSDQVVNQDPLLGNRLDSHAGDRDRALTDGLPGTHGNEDNPMRKTITTTIGTFAGASSLLAFLYKFTPAGRLVNHKLRTTGITNNNFYGEEPNGMLFGGNEHNGFNSYNIGYEAA
ncbi:VIR protein [Plasmodium vivax]|uniref:VIR protein n=1 Tax=Plasmodium vivax TaxID=5855 RepID=A0A1G4HDP9_PLAVI|nr:VIR protein [Plasmodium vivax]